MECGYYSTRTKIAGKVINQENENGVTLQQQHHGIDTSSSKLSKEQKGAIKSFIFLIVSWFFCLLFCYILGMYEYDDHPIKEK
jgi:hypothetical protein